MAAGSNKPQAAGATRIKCAGFTLIELITTIVIISVLAVLGGFLMLAPIDSFTDQTRRAELTDIADNALQRISRELRQALPNSVRIRDDGTRSVLEFINTTTGGRYRARQDTGGGGDPLVDCDDDDFDVLDGNVVAGSDGLTLVLYNTGTDYSAYTGNNTAVITDVDVVNNTMTCDGGNFLFPIPPSSQQRFFVIDTAISYVCDTGTDQLLRYQGYALEGNPLATDTDFTGGSSAVLAGNIDSCTFTYNAGASTRHGLVSLGIVVIDGGERVSLLYQTHVMNIP